MTALHGLLDIVLDRHNMTASETSEIVEQPVAKIEVSLQ